MLATKRSLGFIHLTAIIVVIVIAVAIALAVSQISHRQFSFSKADNQIPSADACNSQLGWEKDPSKSLAQNPKFDSGLSNWTNFTLSGNPNISIDDSYGIDKPTLLISGPGPFVGGVYQTISGLSSGKWYHAFYTTAQDEQPKGITPAIRQILADPSGGTDPSKAQAGLRQSGGQPDKDATRVGGWKTMGNQNNPLVTFQATGTSATIFLKVIGPDSGNYKAWIDSVIVMEDCGKGTIVPPAGGGNGGAGNTGSAANGAAGTPDAPLACNTSLAKLSIDPATAKVGDQVTLNMTSQNGEGTTKISDELTGLGSCQDDLGLGENFDKEGFWPKVPKYKTCTVTATPFKWIHKWAVCPANDQSCSGGPQCSKFFDSATGEQPSTGGNTPGTGTAPLPADLVKAIKDQFGITMTGFDNQSLGWAYSLFLATSTTKFDDLVKGTTITRSADGTSHFAGIAGPNQECTAKSSVVAAQKNQTEFNLMITHELGHVIFFCDHDPESHRSEFDNVYQTEPGITAYGQTGCGLANGIDPKTYSKNEDYAETISFYLNPGQSDSYRGPQCSNGVVPFADPKKYPLHLNLVKKILDKPASGGSK